MVSISSLQLVVGEAHVCFAYIVVFPLHTSLVYGRRLEAVFTKRAVIHDCNLCLREKYVIICQPSQCTLNKLNELVSSCRHRNKALLKCN